jgi:hypothetical protein
MITLYTFGSAFGLPDPSPFVTKAEVLLKMTGLAYQTDPTGFRRAPKGKLRLRRLHPRNDQNNQQLRNRQRLIATPANILHKWSQMARIALSGLPPMQRGGSNSSWGGGSGSGANP